MVKLTNCLERKCQAECCSNFIVLTEAEVRSKEYRMRKVIQPKTKEQFWVLQQAEGKCVYLGENYGCSIYEKRPESCREWVCDEDKAVRL